ncbi:MAG: bacterial Ig-like domain-containing protein [Clostridia bacterium]|nr:bacterial Ig-like domain-containing protein [Clostridia bacterium]
MKKRKLLITLASVLLFACVFVGCKKVEKIDVLKKDMPQVVYVQGSDLNLSSGKLTAVVGDDKVEISLSDPDVSVSGYDKNKLGEQVLTITYEKKVTTIKVTVVPRVVVEKNKTSYFVGEEFDESMGNLVITNDDGTQFNAKISDEAVSVSGFSTETANPAVEVTATYEKDGVSYSGSFKVAVHDIATASLNAPNKKEYDNHETALDLKGGYLTLKNADETLVEHVLLTEDMIKGFDLSAATLEHRESPLEQTLTVEYLGVQKEYKIQINFSDLSLIRLRAEQCKDFTWTEATTPADCDAELGDNVLEAMSVYFGMEDADKKDVDPDQLDLLVKTAATYGLDKWSKAFASYSDAFYLSGGNLYWDCSDYTKTKAVYTSLEQKNPVIYKDSLILKQLETTFGETVIVPAEEDDGEDVTVGDILAAVYDTEMMDNFAGQLKLITSLHESLMSIPKDWTLNDLKTTYKDAVEATWVLLRESDYTHIQYRTLYKLATKWREKQDLFEILYAYYYDPTNLDENGKVNLDKINAFKDFHLTGDLETLYIYLYNAKTQIEQMRSGYAKSDDFMYYYEQALKLKDKILASGSDMEKDLYDRLKFDYLISDGTNFVQYGFDSLFFLFKSTTMGYLYHFNGYLGNEEFEGLWAQNLAIWEEANNGDETYFSSPEFGAAVEAMFKDYMNLSPMQQVVFTNMLNPYYIPISAQGFPSMVWDDSETSYNTFVYFVYKHYRSVLPESTHDAFRQLMLSVENFSRIGMYSTNGYWVVFVEEFKQGMTMVSDYLAAAPAADQAVFKNELGWFYDKYLDFAKVKFQSTEQPKAESLGEWKDDFEELYSALADAYFLAELYNYYQEQGASIGIAVMSAYEKVDEIANRILASNDESIIRAYYYDVMTIPMIMPNGMEATLGGTPDFLVYYIREIYIKFLRGSLFTQDYVLYDYYNDINVNEIGMDLEEFLSKASYLYYTYFYMNTVGSSDADPKFFTDIDLVMELMSDYRNLTKEQKHFVTVLSNTFGMYVGSIMQFGYEQKLGTDANAVVEDLLKVEFYYAAYAMYPAGDSEEEEAPYQALLATELENLLKDYAVLLSEENKESKAKFDIYFGEMYDYYIARCAEAGFNTTLPSTDAQ